MSPTIRVGVPQHCWMMPIPGNNERRCAKTSCTNLGEYEESAHPGINAIWVYNPCENFIEVENIFEKLFF